MGSNSYYAKSIGGSRKDFIDFVKVNTSELPDECLEDIDFLVQRVAQNLYYHEDNLATAKSDYIFLVGMLMRKGVIFEREQGG